MYSLGALLKTELIKGRQPEFLAEDDGSGPRVVATGAIQAGQVVMELTKATTDTEIDAAGPRRLEAGDLLVTMDGEGSIGKAAVFDDNYPAVPDSHVAILRLGSSELAYAMACFLNSSFGQAQFFLVTSGATGQTQISKRDLLNIIVPEDLVRNSSRVHDSFKSELRVFDTRTQRVRREICRSSATLSSMLLADPNVKTEVKGHLSTFEDETQLAALLSQLRPSMF